MSPFLATIVFSILVVGLFLADPARQEKTSKALWLPLAWLAISGSRFVSQWLALGDTYGIDSGEEGSLIDAFYFGTLTAAGMVVLIRRHVSLLDLARRNRWLVAFILFGLVSILWSDFPFIAFKRWAKTLGHPIMALIILTDTNPIAAFKTVMRRCAYLLLPYSMLFVKYYPQYGRGFDGWTGAAVNNGVMLTKNDLGYVCMVLGLFLVWNLLKAHRIVDRHATLA